MPRPRTVNKKIPDLPRGMRQVGKAWYWRGTDALTKEIEQKLRAVGQSMKAGATPIQARLWWEKYISPALVAAMPENEVVGTVEELLRLYEADELPNFKRELTQDEYRGRIGRVRKAFGKRRYAKTETEAMLPGPLRDVDVTKHLHDNRKRGSSANKDVQLLSRIFRLARVRWGKTVYNPCAEVEYLPERPRDEYVSDVRYSEVYAAAGPVLQCMLEISTQTGAREGSIFDIRLGDSDEHELRIRVGKKRNEAGFVVKPYKMTPDLKAAVDRAKALRKKVRGGASSLPADYLFLTRAGKPYTKESFKTLWRRVREKLKLGARELVFHDMRAKAGSDAESDEAAKALLHHEDVKVTRKVYRRRVPQSTPLPSALKGRSEG